MSRWVLIVVTTMRSGGRERRRRNAALAHVDKHYFSGVVHFADAAGVYDAHFFDKIRQTESVLHPSIPFGFSLPFFFCLIISTISFRLQIGMC